MPLNEPRKWTILNKGEIPEQAPSPYTEEEFAELRKKMDMMQIYRILYRNEFRPPEDEEKKDEI